VNPPDRIGYALAFDEPFAGPVLAGDRWVAHHLPHWTTPERSAARYELRPGLLRLRIDADQPAWRVEDGEMRVSNIQTGTSAPTATPPPTPRWARSRPSAGTRRGQPGHQRLHRSRR
jgi:hypothetical protein